MPVVHGWSISVDLRDPRLALPISLLGQKRYLGATGADREYWNSYPGTRGQGKAREHNGPGRVIPTRVGGTKDSGSA